MRSLAPPSEHMITSRKCAIFTGPLKSLWKESNDESGMFQKPRMNLFFIGCQFTLSWWVRERKHERKRSRTRWKETGMGSCYTAPKKQKIIVREKRKKHTTRKSLRASGRGWGEGRASVRGREKRLANPPPGTDEEVDADKQEVLIWAEAIDAKRQQWVTAVRQEVSHLSPWCTSLTVWIIKTNIKRNAPESVVPHLHQIFSSSEELHRVPQTWMQPWGMKMTHHQYCDVCDLAYTANRTNWAHFLHL